MIITINHIKAYGYCTKGARAFFKEYNLDWPAFLANGIEAKKLLATNNALAIELVAKYQEDNNHGYE